jgi:DNA polymerase III alpha subunit (gram-positive type)
MMKDLDDLQLMTRKVYDVGKKVGQARLRHGRLALPGTARRDLPPHHPNGMGFSSERQAPLFFKTTDEMMEDFAYFGPEAAREVVVENPQKVADLIEDVDPIPNETLSPQFEGADELLRETAVKRALELYGDPLPPFIDKRMNKELDSVIQNKFSTLYVLAMKLVKKSNERRLPGGKPGVGRLVPSWRFLCGITEVNPLPPHWRCAERPLARVPRKARFDRRDRSSPQGMSRVRGSGGSRWVQHRLRSLHGLQGRQDARYRLELFRRVPTRGAPVRGGNAWQGQVLPGWHYFRREG